MHALVDAGADIIEVGVPFSDPMSEGPTIQKGHERALEAARVLNLRLHWLRNSDGLMLRHRLC